MSGSMKVTDFMLNLAKQMQDERKIGESTTQQYLQTLFKLNGSKPFNNLAWAKKRDSVQEVINTYAKSTQGNQYMVLSSALSLFKDKATYKATYNHWKDKMMEARNEARNEPLHEKSDKQEENWLTWEEVSKKKLELNEECSSFLSNKNISSNQFDKLQQYVVLCLYTDIQPRRNADYSNMFCVKKLGKDYDKTKNYYDLSTHKFHFNIYKTAKKWGEQIEEVPESLQKVLNDYIKFHPLASSKTKEFKLLVKSDGSVLNSLNGITRILNKIFGKKVGSSMLRHIYLSSKYGDTIKEMEKDQVAMSHTGAVQSGYIKV